VFSSRIARTVAAVAVASAAALAPAAAQAGAPPVKLRHAALPHAAQPATTHRTCRLHGPRGKAQPPSDPRCATPLPASMRAVAKAASAPAPVTNLWQPATWDTCRNDYMKPGRFVTVTSPYPNEYTTSSGGFTFYWTSVLVSWDGRYNRWLPSVQGASDAYGGGQWNHQYVMQSAIDLKQYPDMGTQTYIIGGHQVYTAAYVTTWYLVGNTWYGGHTHYVGNNMNTNGLFFTPLVNGWCFWS
jgi:hypothetical protein